MHVCPSRFFFLFFFFEKLWDTGGTLYLLFIFSFNLEHLFSYILFTLLDLILGLYSNLNIIY